MAKRNVRRARAESRAPAAPPPAAPAHRTRQFWLGVLAAGCVLVPLGVAGAIVAGSGGDVEVPGRRASAVQAPTPTPTPESEAERMQAIAQARDKGQVQELTDRMRGVSDALDPVLRGVARTLPLGEKDEVGPLARAAEVKRWRRVTRPLAKSFEETVSGETGTNIARSALATAVRGADELVATYALALADPGARPALLESARAQRDLALSAWETAAVEIDVINIAVGFGHQHPLMPGIGEKAPDDLPEGTDAGGDG